MGDLIHSLMERRGSCLYFNIREQRPCPYNSIETFLSSMDLEKRNKKKIPNLLDIFG
jgi:hypothetical protein